MRAPMARPAASSQSRIPTSVVGSHGHNMSQPGLAKALIVVHEYQHNRLDRRQGETSHLELNYELLSKRFDKGDSLKCHRERFREVSDACVPLFAGSRASRPRLDGSHSGTLYPGFALSYSTSDTSIRPIIMLQSRWSMR